MAGAYMFGWDATNKVWVKCLVNAEGKLIIDPSEIFENIPTDDEHGKAPDSDWGHDHAANVDAHHAQLHAASHKDGGGDELDVVELAGGLGTANQVPKSDGAAVSWGNVDHSEVTGVGSDDHHSQLHQASHENGGVDEISVAGLSGVLADKQDPQAHAANHKDGGGDELDAAELAGALGTDGQILTSGGAACSWQDPAGGGVPSGSRMLFKNWSAPTGWTFVAEDNDRVILNTSTKADGSKTGGSWTISGLSGSVSGHALSVSELPSHNHGGGDHNHSYTGLVSGYQAEVDDLGPYAFSTSNTGSSGTIISSEGGGGSHDHGFSWSQDGSWRPAYVKVITCQKD